MKKLAVLTSFVFLFGMGAAAMADTVNYNDVVQAGGAAANDGGTAVAASNNLNENQLGSNNTYTDTKSFTLDASSTKTEVEDSYNTDNSKDQSTNTFGVSKAAFGSASNVGSGEASVSSEFHAKGEVVNTTTTTTNAPNSSKTNADNYNKQEVEAEGKGNAATMTGDALADSRDQSSHTYVEAEAEEGSLAAINTTGNLTLDKSTTISISNIGLALQKNELKGEVEHNVLIVGGPEAVSVTSSGKTETGETESGEAKSGAALSGAKSGSHSGAAAFAAGEGATADANSGSESDASSKAKSGSAASGQAVGGSAAGGAAVGAAASATTTFYTGANDFTTGSFNGIATFNVNSGVNSLQQSPISVNAVVGGGVAAQQ